MYPSSSGQIPSVTPNPSPSSAMSTTEMATATTVTEKSMDELEMPTIDKKGDWMDIVHTRKTECDASTAYKTNLVLSCLPPDCQEEYNIDKHFEDKGLRVKLEPDKAYKIRVAAVNPVGIGPWSEVSTYRNPQVPTDLPAAPHTVRINKLPSGVSISWEPPQSSGGVGCHIVEYSVYLSTIINVSNGQTLSAECLHFERIYCGPTPECFVSNETLKKAKIDLNNIRPCYILRIAARNERDYGPATQVRWLQGAGTM